MELNTTTRRTYFQSRINCYLSPMTLNRDTMLSYGISVGQIVTTETLGSCRFT